MRAMGDIPVLKSTLKNFNEKQERRLLNKVQEGWEGWDWPGERTHILHKLIWNLVNEEWVDVANLAMFLWRFDGEKDK